MADPSIDNISTTLGDFGGAVSELFGAFGSEQAASAYDKEATIAKQNAAISQTSSQIQQAQEARQVTQAVGTEESGTAAAGFTMGGNASDLLRQSLQQGALATSLIKQQGTITTLGYEEQAQAAEGKAAASQTQAAGGLLGGLIKGAGTVLSLFSDRRLKENIVALGQMRGFNIYAYNYVWDKTHRVGVMADEVEKIIPEAVTEVGGFKKVNYTMLGLEGIC